MTNQFSASTASPANTEKPPEKVTPAGDPQKSVPDKAPMSPAPTVKS